MHTPITPAKPPTAPSKKPNPLLEIAVTIVVPAGILMKLDSRKAGVILNEMDSEPAATLTGIMAAAARREDPS